MIIEKISPRWYKLTLNQRPHKFIFFGYSKAEVVGKLKAHLRSRK